MGATNKILAYSVQAAECRCVVFTGRNVVARRLGAGQLDCTFGEVETCRRASAFDRYAAVGTVPVKALLDVGWSWRCQHCDARVSESCGYVIYDEQVYCCEACRDLELAERIMQKRHSQAWADCAHEKWPGVTVLHASEFRGDAYVTFAFPGGENHASWNTKERALHVAPMDQPAWAAFTGMDDGLE